MQNKYTLLQPLSFAQQIFDLSGKVGVITGGAGKMGREFAAVLLRAGSEIVISDVDDARCQSAKDSLSTITGKEVVIFPCDVAESQSVSQLFREVHKRFGRFDFLISNVMGKPKDYYHPFNDYPLAAWKEIHDINLTGTFLCAREAAKIMEENAGGSMVFTASVYGVVAPDLRIYEQSPPAANIYGGNYPLTTPAAYSSSKGALISLARYLAVALAPTGIRVNVLTPGGVYDGQDESFHSSYVQRTPLGRMAVWSDFNGAILFLVSDASRYMTGANLVIDGGWTAW